VIEVISGGPAADAGIQDNDVIVEFDGTSIHTPGKLQETVEEKEIGSTRKITVMREGKRVTLDVKMRALAENPPGTPAKKP
jgi:serine protease Do